MLLLKLLKQNTRILWNAFIADAKAMLTSQNLGWIIKSLLKPLLAPHWPLVDIMESALGEVQWKGVFWIPKHVNLKSLSTMTTIKGSVYEIKEAGVVLKPIGLASQNKATGFIWAGSKSQFVAD